MAENRGLDLREVIFLCAIENLLKQMFYTITNYYDPVGHKNLLCKCPDCGAIDRLSLEFFQKRVVSSYSEKTTNKVSGVLYCHQTKTEVLPVLWTDEIEHYFNTEKSKLKLHPIRTKFSKRFRFLLVLLVMTLFSVITGFLYEIYQANRSASIEHIAPGTTIKVSHAQVDQSTSTGNLNTWFLINKIESDSVWLQKFEGNNKRLMNDLQSQKSNEVPENLKVSLKKLKQWLILPHDYNAYSFSGFVMEIE